MVKSLSLSIGTDWEPSRAIGHNFRLVDNALNNMQFSIFEDMCAEEKWWHTFSKHIQPHHDLNKLVIQLKGWRSINVRGDCFMPRHEMTLPEDREDLQKWRGKLLNFFDDYMRGISNVKITCMNVDGRGLTRKQIDGLEIAMSRPKSTAKMRKLKKKLTISVALAQVKLDKGQEEAGEEWLGG